MVSCTTQLWLTCLCCVQTNNLQMIVRAHECVMDGFERFAQGHLITLFSATNYCGTANNAGEPHGKTSFQAQWQAEQANHQHACIPLSVLARSLSDRRQ